MSVEWLASLDEAREALAALDDAPDPFMSGDWLAAWSGAFGAGMETRVALLSRGGEPAALLPLMASPGGGLRAMANDHTPVFRPLARDHDALEELVAAAIAASAGRLVLPAVPHTHPLLRERFGAWHAIASSDTIVSPIVDLRGTYEEWRELTRPRWQTPIERLRRKMGRDHELELRLVEIPQNLDSVLDAAFAVEASGWKGAAGTAIASDPHTESFYRTVAHAFASREQLRISSISLDGTMVAFGLALLHGGRLYQLKTGFDESLRRLAPGLVLQLSIIERCFELGLDAYEFLGDTSEWKRKFATSDRVQRTWTGYARGVRGSGVYAYRRVRRAAAGALRARQRP